MEAIAVSNIGNRPIMEQHAIKM